MAGNQPLKVSVIQFNCSSKTFVLYHLFNFIKRETNDVFFFRNRDARPADLIIDENFKNKSPKGSKTSIGKSSPV